MCVDDARNALGRSLPPGTLSPVDAYSVDSWGGGGGNVGAVERIRVQLYHDSMLHLILV